MGGTMRGTIYTEQNQYDLAGTYVPLFGLNNVFQKLPIFGPLLGGREGEVEVVAAHGRALHQVLGRRMRRTRQAPDPSGPSGPPGVASLPPCRAIATG